MTRATQSSSGWCSSPARASGESAPSTPVSATPSAGGGGVALTASYLAATPNSTQVTLNWFPVSTATSYNLYWSTAPGVTPLTGMLIANVTSPFAHTGRAASTTYYYRIRANNSLGGATANTNAQPFPIRTGI